MLLNLFYRRLLHLTHFQHKMSLYLYPKQLRRLFQVHLQKELSDLRKASILIGKTNFEATPNNVPIVSNRFTNRKVNTTINISSVKILLHSNFMKIEIYRVVMTPDYLWASEPNLISKQKQLQQLYL